MLTSDGNQQETKVQLSEPMIFFGVAYKKVGKGLFTEVEMTQRQLYHWKPTPGWVTSHKSCNPSKSLQLVCVWGGRALVYLVQSETSWSPWVVEFIKFLCRFLELFLLFHCLSDSPCIMEITWKMEDSTLEETSTQYLCKTIWQ